MRIVSILTKPETEVVTVTTLTPGVITFEDETNSMEVTDSYHTMSELYEHRHALFCALCKVYDGYKTPLGSNVTCYKSKLHSNGTMDEGQFIVMMIVHNLNTTIEQISYHLPMEWWDKFNIMELERMWEWDGHSSDDIIKRLVKL